MSTLWIEEWQQVRPDINGNIANVPHISPGRTQLTYTTTSVRTSFAFDTATTFVILYSDIDSYVMLGDNNVTADQTGFILPANTFRTFGIAGGQTHIAVIQKV